MSHQTATNKDIKHLYNTSIDEKYEGDYEFRRWFLTDRLRLDYYMTRTAIAHHLKHISFSSCLEFGPGAGTFSALPFRKNPKAQFDLLDISEAMKKQFHLELRGADNVQYRLNDILEYEPESMYDLFYSIRAVEYVDDKKAFFKKVCSLLNPGGHGLIVTKNPFYGSAEHGESTRSQHTGKLSMSEMKQLLEESGFSHVNIFPVIFRLPLIERLTLKFTEKYFEKNYAHPVSSKISKYMESYIVTFQKPA